MLGSALSSSGEAPVSSCVDDDGGFRLAAAGAGAATLTKDGIVSAAIGLVLLGRSGGNKDYSQQLMID